MIVTIDGPAGAGKSSAAKSLARRLGFQFLDTGAMYRAVTLAALEKDCDFDNEEEIKQLLDTVSIEMPPGKVLLNSKDVTRAIRTLKVTDASRHAANNQLVRQKLAEVQRAIAADRDIVCEGRDQGTIVFPDATCKFFLTANAESRARRRYEELKEAGENIRFEDVLHAQIERDERDKNRSIAPMVPAADAVHIDSSKLSLNEVVNLMEQKVRSCSNG